MTNDATAARTAPRTAPHGSPQTRSVGFVMDEGVPADFATALTKELPARLREHVQDDVDWRVQVVNDPVALDEHGSIPMVELARRYRSENDWHIVVLVTDLPLRLGTVPLIADYNTEHGVALVSLPALGAVRRRQRLSGLLVPLIERLAQHDTTLGQPPARATADEDLAEGAGSFLVRVRHRPSQSRSTGHHLAMVGLPGRLRMLVGTVRSNRPWRLVPSLEGATAAAATTAAFPLFYSGIWPMAVTLHPARLALISVLAITAMVIWFVCYNRLWDLPSTHRLRGEAMFHNVSMVLTLAIGVAVMYVMLFILTLLAALTVIDGGYLQSQLGRPAGLDVYSRIVWLACSMGIIAGALGSSFDSEEAVRQAAFSRREQQRQARHRQQNDAGENDG